MAALLLALALLASSTPLSSASITWSSCSPEGSAVSVQNVTMDPDPAVAGDAFSLNLPAVASRDIDSGSVVVYVTYKNIPVHIEKDDLCSKTPCPVPAGDFVFQNSQLLPAVTPPGVYKVKLTALDSENGVLFCATIQFQVVKASSMEHGAVAGNQDEQDQGLDIIHHSKPQDKIKLL